MTRDVRPARHEDASRIQDLYEHHKNSEQILGLPYDLEDWRLYLSAPHVKLLVATHDDAIVGFLLGYDLVNWGYVETLVVERGERRCGYGAWLLDAFQSLGRDRWVAVELSHDPDDRDLAHWLEVRGFTKPDLLEWRVKLTNLWKDSGRPPVDLSGTAGHGQ